MNKRRCVLNPIMDYPPHQWGEFTPEAEIRQRMKNWWFRYATVEDQQREVEALIVRRMRKAVEVP